MYLPIAVSTNRFPALLWLCCLSPIVFRNTNLSFFQIRERRAAERPATPYHGCEWRKLLVEQACGTGVTMKLMWFQHQPTGEHRTQQSASPRESAVQPQTLERAHPGIGILSSACRCSLARSASAMRHSPIRAHSNNPFDTTSQPKPACRCTQEKTNTKTNQDQPRRAKANTNQQSNLPNKSSDQPLLSSLREYGPNQRAWCLVQYLGAARSCMISSRRTTVVPPGPPRPLLVFPMHPSPSDSDNDNDK